MVHSAAVESRSVSVPEDGFDDFEFANYWKSHGQLQHPENNVSSVPEDGYDDFEFAKYLEDCGLLKRSHSLPTALTTHLSSVAGKVLSMCSLMQTTMVPLNVLSDDTSAVDYVETAYSVFDKICSGCDEIQKIVTGGADDGWYQVSSPDQSPAACFGTMPVSSQGFTIGCPIMHGGSRHPTSVAIHDATLARSIFAGTGRSETVDAGDRPIAPTLDCACLESSAKTSKFPMEEQMIDGLEEVTSKTTLMFCNIPHHYSRSMVMDMLQSEGFAEHVEFIYLPMNLREVHNFGYAFVAFDSVRTTLQCREKLQGFTSWNEPPEKPMEIEWSDTQGLDANIERYRNSPIMHESVQDELKPALFKRCVRVAFPKPTKSIRAPRLRRSGNQSHQNNLSPN